LGCLRATPLRRARARSARYPITSLPSGEGRGGVKNPPLYVRILSPNITQWNGGLTDAITPSPLGEGKGGVK